jgi:hypothetical protein
MNSGRQTMVTVQDKGQTYQVDLQNGRVGAQKTIRRTGTVYYQNITSAPKLKRILKIAKTQGEAGH